MALQVDKMVLVAKELEPKDNVIKFFKRSIAHAKHWDTIVASYYTLKEYMQERYNVELPVCNI